jgi:hypothetical protein
MNIKGMGGGEEGQAKDSPPPRHGGRLQWSGRCGRCGRCGGGGEGFPVWRGGSGQITSRSKRRNLPNCGRGGKLGFNVVSGEANG